MTRPSPRDVTSDANSARNVERGSITCYSSESITKKHDAARIFGACEDSCVVRFDFGASCAENLVLLNAPLALPVNRGPPCSLADAIHCQPNFLRLMKAFCAQSFAPRRTPAFRKTNRVTFLRSFIFRCLLK